MLLPLDGPSKQLKITVTDSAVLEAKADTLALTERKVITMQPLDGSIKVYFSAEAEVPNAATVSAHGFDHPKKAIRSYEASDKQKVFILAAGGSVQVVVAERA